MTSPTLCVDKTKIIPVDLSSEVDLSDFDCGIDDLNDFIRSDAFEGQRQNVTQTTCIMHHDKVIGYYSLSSDSIPLKIKERKGVFGGYKQYPDYPSLKLARMAFDKRCHKQGLGKLMIKVILGMALDLNKEGIACRFITVDAGSQAIDFYKKNGFVENLSKPAEEGKPVSMRLDIFKYKPTI